MTQKNVRHSGVGTALLCPAVPGGRRPECNDLSLTAKALHLSLKKGDKTRKDGLRTPPHTLISSPREHSRQPSIRRLDLKVFPTEVDTLVSTAFKNCKSRVLPIDQT